MKVNVVVMNHVALELIALLLLKLKKYYLSVFVFYLLEVWKDVGIGTIGVLGINSNYYDLSVFDLVLVETILIDRCRR